MTPGSYEAAVGRASGGGVVSAVEPGSPAARAGVRAGDVVLTVDGSPVRDVIDWQWLTAEPRFELGLADVLGERGVIVERAWDEAVGVTFSATLFDGVRECDNACSFCFVAQLPAGLRPSLYVRDDDFRLSFLAGTFVTLTNLTDDDVARIVGQRLSPLHVSLHAVDAEVRRRLVCPTVDDRALERIDELVAARIALHVQIVLVPGVNDGEVLDRTLAWLADRGTVLSVGVVPLGFTKHQSRFARSFGDPADAAAVLDQLHAWRARMAVDRGVRWVHAADELYLAAGRELPRDEDYDDYPQYENGIGLVRAFVDEWDEAVAEIAPRDPAVGGALSACTLVTGTLFAPALRTLVARSGDALSACSVLPVPNAFFGGNVSVTGLLTGADITDAVRRDAGGGPYLVPGIVLNDDGLTLDGVAGGDLAALTGKDVRVVPYDAAGLVHALADISGAGAP